MLVTHYLTKRDSREVDERNKQVSNSSTSSSTSSRSRSVMSNLCCDVCFEPFNSSKRKPLIICSNGHSVCSYCSRSMKSCPQCRAKCLETPIPNISLLKTLDNLVNLKFLVIGEPGVGKSSLMLRFTEEKFSTDILPTVGLDFRVKVMDHKGYSVKLSIWDTAGQERFKNITSAYYRGAHGVILVYDLTSRRSFENLEHWLVEEAKHNTETKTKKLVVGNKSDQKGRRRISYEEGANWAERRGFLFLETSAKNNAGVETAFYNLVDRILQEPALWEKDLQGVESRETSQRPGIRIENRQGRDGGTGRNCCN